MLVDFIVGACLNKESLCLKASLNASSLQMAGWDGEGSATRCPGGRGGGSVAWSRFPLDPPSPNPLVP